MCIRDSATLGPDLGETNVHTNLLALGCNEVEFGLGVGRESVDRDDAGPVSYTHLDVYKRQDGAWLTESDSREPRYAVIHRCAISAAAARRGICLLYTSRCV